jgi:hypothetical protein
MLHVRLNEIHQIFQTIFGSSRLYLINTQTGATTAVGADPFTPGLQGTAFGFDFNPTAGTASLIRVVSDAGQNLRLNPDLGTVVDSDPNTGRATKLGKIDTDDAITGLAVPIP